MKKAGIPFQADSTPTKRANPVQAFAFPFALLFLAASACGPVADSSRKGPSSELAQASQPKRPKNTPRPPSGASPERPKESGTPPPDAPESGPGGTTDPRAPDSPGPDAPSGPSAPAVPSGHPHDHAHGDAEDTTPHSPDPSWFPSRECEPFWNEERIDHEWASGSDSDYETYYSRSRRAECFKPWTVLVYMAADNDLAPYAVLDLHEMEAASDGTLAGSRERSDWIVQLDTAGDTGIERIHVQPGRAPYRPALTRDDIARQSERLRIESPVVQRLPETRSEAEHRDAFREFLEWGVRTYPARHYMVIVWGHGQGWAPASGYRPVKSRYLDESASEAAGLIQSVPLEAAPLEALEAPFLPLSTLLGRAGSPAGDGSEGAGEFASRRFGGIAFDDTGGTFLDIPSLREAMRSVTAEVLENPELAESGRLIDVYASDACLMQMLEVAYEISDVTRFIVGSAQVQNYLGLPYRRIIHELNSGFTASGPEPYLTARMIPEVFRQSMEEGEQGQALPKSVGNITMSSVSSHQLRWELRFALEDLSLALLEYLEEDRLRAIDVQFVLQRAFGFQGGAKDLGGFLGLMKDLLYSEAAQTGGLSRGASGLLRRIDEAKSVLHYTAVNYVYGDAYRGIEHQLHLLGFKALSVWLPVSREDFESRIGDFTQSRFYRALGSWHRWLGRVYGH